MLASLLFVTLTSCSAESSPSDVVFHFIKEGVFLNHYQKVRDQTSLKQSQVARISKTISKDEKQDVGYKFNIFLQNQKSELVHTNF